MTQILKSSETQPKEKQAEHFHNEHGSQQRPGGCSEDLRGRWWESELRETEGSQCHLHGLQAEAWLGTAVGG